MSNQATLAGHCRSLPGPQAPDSPDFSTGPGVFGCNRSIALATTEILIRDGVVQGRCVKRAKWCRDSAGLSHVAVPWLLWFLFAFGIAMSISMQHRFIREETEAAGRALPWSSRGRAKPVPGREKAPPGSCSVALSDRSQCDSTGPAAVWADDQAVTRALQARKSPRHICLCKKGRCLPTATSSRNHKPIHSNERV